MNKNECGVVQKDQKRKAAVAAIRDCETRWPSTVVARPSIKEFSGGAIAAGTMANLDCAGTGVPGAFKIGRTVVYPVKQLIEWLIARIEV